MRTILSSTHIDTKAAKAKELNDKLNLLNAKSRKQGKVLPQSSIKHETVDDLKARLGDNMPKVLETFKKQSENTGKGQDMAL